MSTASDLRRMKKMCEKPDDLSMKTMMYMHPFADSGDSGPEISVEMYACTSREMYACTSRSW
eukprot:681409-Prorocentrum_minimum.AAC.1